MKKNEQCSCHISQRLTNQLANPSLWVEGFRQNIVQPWYSLFSFSKSWLKHCYYLHLAEYNSDFNTDVNNKELAAELK